MWTPFLCLLLKSTGYINVWVPHWPGFCRLLPLRLVHCAIRGDKSIIPQTPHGNSYGPSLQNLDLCKEKIAWNPCKKKSIDHGICYNSDIFWYFNSPFLLFSPLLFIVQTLRTNKLKSMDCIIHWWYNNNNNIYIRV